MKTRGPPGFGTGSFWVVSGKQGAVTLRKAGAVRVTFTVPDGAKRGDIRLLFSVFLRNVHPRALAHKRAGDDRQEDRVLSQAGSAAHRVTIRIVK